jgi:hypothetical protein
MELINLTPHTINIFSPSGEELAAIEPSGDLARCEVNMEGSGTLPGPVPTFVATCGDIEGLPGPEAGKTFIVSGMVEAACDRPDVYAPGELLRGPDGRPKGCVGLKQT